MNTVRTGLNLSRQVQTKPLQSTSTVASLQALPPARLPLRLCSIQWDTVVPSLMRSKSAILHRSDLFTLRAVPDNQLPSRTSSPFPPRPDSEGSSSTSPIAQSDPLRSSPAIGKSDFVPFAIITSIKAISKRAVERNRVRTRFKAAVRMVLTRGARGDPSSQNKSQGSDPSVKTKGQDSTIRLDPVQPLILPKHHYLAQLNPSVYSIPMPLLVEGVYKGLSSIYNKSKRTGNESGPRSPVRKGDGGKNSKPRDIGRREMKGPRMTAGEGKDGS